MSETQTALETLNLAFLSDLPENTKFSREHYDNNWNALGQGLSSFSSALQQQMATVLAKLEELEALDQNGTNQEEIQALQAEITQLSGTLSTFETTVDGNFSTLTTQWSEKIQTLEKAIEELDNTALSQSQLTEIAENITFSEAELSAIAKLVALTPAQLAELAQSLTLSTQELETVASLVEFTAEQLASFKGEPGENYTLTAQDKTDISAQVALTEADKTEIAAMAKGEPGITPNIEIGNVETLPYTEEVSVEIDPSSTAENVILNVGIPQGAPADAPVEELVVTVTGTSSTLIVKKLPSGIVLIQSQMLTTSSITSGTIICTLPEGYKPVANMYLPIASTQYMGQVSIDTDGRLFIYLSATITSGRYFGVTGSYYAKGVL